MPAKTDAQKQLMATIKRVNMGLPAQHWVPDLRLLRELIDTVLREEQPHLYITKPDQDQEEEA